MQHCQQRWTFPLSRSSNQPPPAMFGQLLDRQRENACVTPGIRPCRVREGLLGEGVRRLRGLLDP
jgi:hypothetical protein